MTHSVDVVVIGGGQAALATAYFLRRTGLSYVILDDRTQAGGAWTATWPSLRLFSPARWSGIPGWPMPGGADEYPTRDEVVAYLTEYERRYALPVVRPVHVERVLRDGGALTVESDSGRWRARAVVSATGTASAPRVPVIDGEEAFQGERMHSVDYRGAERFRGRRVIVVGGGNSGAQIFADLVDVAQVEWATLADPRFLPDDVDGKVLFDQATARYHALQSGEPTPPVRSLGDIVMVPAVRAVRDRGLLVARRMFVRFVSGGVVWPSGDESAVDAVIFATGFAPAMGHLQSLGIVDARGRVAVRGTRAVDAPGVWLVGYGEWTGFASATLIGVGRSARATVDEIVTMLRNASENEQARRSD